MQFFNKKLLSFFNIPVILFFILLTFVTYTNILPNQLFYDDEELIYKNAYIKNLRYFPKYFTENMVAGAGKKSNLYRPVLLLSFAFDHLIWKNNPAGYHLTSIFLHAVNAILIFFLIWKLFKNRFLSFLTSLFFIVHPANSEAVIYASGRTDPLYTFFTLLSMILFLSFINNKHHKLKIKLYILAIICFIFALLSKESAIVLPFLLIVIPTDPDLIGRVERSSTNCLQKSHVGRFLDKLGMTFFKQVLIFFPFFLIDIIYILLRLTILNFSYTLNFYQTPTLYSQNLLIRLYTFTYVFFQYLGILIFPADLIFARSITPVSSPFNISVILFIVITAFLSVFSIIKWRRNKLFLFVFLWFFIALFPVSGIIPINSIIAEHFLYLPSVSFFLIISYIFVSFWKKYAGFNLRLALFTAFSFIYLSLFIRTIIRTFDWRDPITFYTKSIKKSPGNIPMRHNLAMAYAEKGNYDLAIREYQKLIALADVYPNTHHNLANALKEIGKYKEAEEEYMKALKMDPDFAFSYYGLADLYQKTGEKEKLEEVLKKIRNNK